MYSPAIREESSGPQFVYVIFPPEIVIISIFTKNKWYDNMKIWNICNQGWDTACVFLTNGVDQLSLLQNLVYCMRLDFDTFTYPPLELILHVNRATTNMIYKENSFL